MNAVVENQTRQGGVLPVTSGDTSATRGGCAGRAPFDAVDRALVQATQAGLPLVSRPYHALADALGIAPEEVMSRFRRMLETNVIRRVAAVPNHYALGYKANGMSVWDVDDAQVREAGAQIGALPFVSHCYRRPRHPPEWPYNLFAMVHGRDRHEVEDKVRHIAAVLGERQRAHEVLYSRRILKKTGLRLVARE
jgi:DNA-binding Lrp family transcriptional regulator